MRVTRAGRDLTTPSMSTARANNEQTTYAASLRRCTLDRVWVTARLHAVILLRFARTSWSARDSPVKQHFVSKHSITA